MLEFPVLVNTFLYKMDFQDMVRIRLCLFCYAFIRYHVIFVEKWTIPRAVIIIGFPLCGLSSYALK